MVPIFLLLAVGDRASRVPHPGCHILPLLPLMPICRSSCCPSNEPCALHATCLDCSSLVTPEFSSCPFLLGAHLPREAFPNIHAQLLSAQRFSASLDLFFPLTPRSRLCYFFVLLKCEICGEGLFLFILFSCLFLTICLLSLVSSPVKE